MSDGAEIRDLTPADLPEIKRIHEASGLDYQLPNILSPLFLVKKVLDVEGDVRMGVGAYLTLECYLWMDESDWADPEQKLVAIEELGNVAIREAREKGLEEVILFLPPEKARFGKRLVENLGFSPDRTGWKSYSKRI